jgi:cytochrome c peroxidase
VRVRPIAHLAVDDVFRAGANTMKIPTLAGPVALLLAGGLSAAVATGQTAHMEPHANQIGLVFDGRIIDAIEFFKPHDDGNGRSCATCHRPEDGFGLTPATVEARYQMLQARRRVNPGADDPLFRSIDADDFDQDFTTLRTKALVRVTLPLAANVTLADDPAAGSVTVWRSVPTVVNARLTAPYQAEGRLATLPEQALAAIREHSEVTGDVDTRVLRRLARFQEQLFSSDRVRDLARALESGEPPPQTDPPLNRLERQGRITFREFCATCHGGPTQTVNGDARFLPVPQRGPFLQGAQAFVNIFVQTPRTPPGPPMPLFFQDLPTAKLEERAYIVTLPGGARQTIVTSDPGRGAITGDPREFGRFDVPTLFGVARTAPYFHDNSAGSLEDVIRHYQALFELLTFFANGNLFAPVANGQGCNSVDCGFRSLLDEEVPGLLAYLRKQ